MLSFESIDLLDHVIFVYRTSRGWGSVARSRDPGLHGRRPLFATPRTLALSYFESHIDFTGRIKAYAVVDLRVMGTYDWRLSTRNVWKVEQMLDRRRTGASLRPIERPTRCGAVIAHFAGARLQTVEVLQGAGALDAAAGRVRPPGLD